MAERVREMRIHHPRSAVLRYISVSVGVSALVPESADSPAELLKVPANSSHSRRNPGAIRPRDAGRM